jgi:hypothetical protein
VVRSGLRRGIVRALLRQLETEGEQEDAGLRVLFLSPDRTRRGRRGAPPGDERPEPPAAEPAPILASVTAS